MGFARKLRGFLHSSKLDAEIDEELRFHLEMREKTNEKLGMQPDEARFNARRRFGNATALKESTRDADLLGFVDTTFQDIRFGVRTFLRNPVFTAVAVVTLALGIGANTAIFSLLDGIALRDLGVPHPEQLVRVGANIPGDSFAGLSFPMYEE